MAGTDTPPGAVSSAIESSSILMGTLSWMVDPGKSGVTTATPITAIWRNEVGTAQVLAGQPHS